MNLFAARARARQAGRPSMSLTDVAVAARRWLAVDLRSFAPHYYRTCWLPLCLCYEGPGKRRLVLFSLAAPFALSSSLGVIVRQEGGRTGGRAT